MSLIFKPYVSPFYLFGVDDPSVTATAVGGAEQTLTVTANWTTNRKSSGGPNYLVLTSPIGLQYSVSATASPPGTSHSLTRICPCEVGKWTYVVKSTRPSYGTGPAFTTRGSNVHGFMASCIE